MNTASGKIVALLVLAGLSSMNMANANISTEPSGHPMCAFAEAEWKANSHLDPVVSTILPGKNGVAQKYLSKHLAIGTDDESYGNNSLSLFE